MNDDDLCKMIKGNSGGGKLSTIAIQPSLDSSSSEPISGPNKTSQGCVILRKIFTITTLKIYPNGEVYTHSSKSWVDRDKETYVKKKKKKPKKIKQSKIKRAEVL